MSKTKPKYIRQVHASSEAPDLLLKQIVELQKVLFTASNAENKNQKAIDFYTGILSTMKYSYDYMMKLHWIYKRNLVLENENAFLKDWSASLQDDLLKYQVVQEAKLVGNFDELVKHVDDYINNTDI